MHCAVYVFTTMYTTWRKKNNRKTKQNDACPSLHHPQRVRGVREPCTLRPGPAQLPHIHQLVLDAAEVLNIPPPQLYIRQSSQPNAYTLAISGREPVVVVHTALIELMTEAELQAVIAHEMGHLKCDHGVWLTVANLLTLGVEILPIAPSFVVGNLQDNLMRWVRAAELSCDRAALLVAGDPKVVVSVLMKLSGGCPKLATQLNVDAFLDQARGYDEASNSPLGWYLRNAQTRQLTHPLPVARAREIDEWARSAEFKALGVAPAPAPAGLTDHEYRSSTIGECEPAE